MKKDYTIFEHYSVTAELGVTVIDVTGDTRFKSEAYKKTEGFLRLLSDILDCLDACRISLLYACYQARRFGGRYVFCDPAGLYYCASPITNERGEMTAGVVAGPFLMTEHEEYIEIDVLERHRASEKDAARIGDGICIIPVITPARARAVSETIFMCASHFSGFFAAVDVPAPQADALSSAYSIEREDALLDAISRGDVEAANREMNNILGQILFHYGDNLEILRSRVVELTVLLSRAALRGGANIDAIFGLNYSYLREIDALTEVDDVVMWLHKATRRFAQNVFDFAGAKHVDIIYKAVEFIKNNYGSKITLQDISDHVFLSPTYFSKIFKEETGQTPGGYITGVRIEQSKRLLRDLTVSVSDISELAGFESQSYFTKVFKKAESCTPGQYRQKHALRKN